MDSNRRQFLAAGGALGLASLTLGADSIRAADQDEAEEVSAIEDLMREHGVLNRILLVFEEGLRRIQAKADVSPEVFRAPAALVRKFVEDYHEKLEENFIFPEFEKRKQLVEVVKVLREQHQAGRKVTDIILRSTDPERFRKEDARSEVVVACQAFIRMYRPHEAREDTVVFPALKKLLDSRRLAELGEQFEKEEDRLFGDEGFEKTVDQVATIEKHLGIYELSQFTPR